MSNRAAATGGVRVGRRTRKARAQLTPTAFLCCFCEQAIEEPHPVNPIALVVIANWRAAKDGREVSQQFFCHVACLQERAPVVRDYLDIREVAPPRNQLDGGGQSLPTRR